MLYEKIWRPGVQESSVLTLLDAIYLRLRKISVQRVTVVKFRADDGCSVAYSPF